MSDVQRHICATCDHWSRAKFSCCYRSFAPYDHACSAWERKGNLVLTHDEMKQFEKYYDKMYDLYQAAAALAIAYNEIVEIVPPFAQYKDTLRQVYDLCFDMEYDFSNWFWDAEERKENV